MLPPRTGTGLGTALRRGAAGAGLLALLALLAGAAGAAGAEGAAPDGSAASAEPGAELARAQYTAAEPAAVRHAAPGETGTLGLVFRDAFVNLPVAGVDTPTLWFTGLTTRVLSLNFAGGDPAAARRHVPELSSATVHLGLHHTVDADQALLVIVATGRFADDLGADVPLSTGGLAVWRWRLGPAARWGLGVSAGADFGDPLATPLVEYARWDARWTVALRLPLEGQARYWLSERVSVGAQWLVQGGQYRVTAPGAAVDTARVTAGTLTGVLALGRRTGPLLELATGRTLFQRYRALRGGDDAETVNFAAAPVHTLSVAWRF